MAEHKKEEAAAVTETVLEPQLEQTPGSTPGSSIHIGMVGNYADSDETRMLLTPEACGMLTSAGIKVSMEAGAGVDISFSDEAYSEYGVKIVTREDALKCPIVLSFMPLKAKDVKKMTKGSALMCMMGHDLFESATIKALLTQHISTVCLDNMYSNHEVTIFADILDEIDGRGAIVYAEEALSYLGGGKGVLLAGVAGLNPCEVLVIGADRACVHAANSAAANGAKVVVMNNDVSALELIRPSLMPQVELVAIHPRVLANRVKTADVIIMGNTTREFKFPQVLSSQLKDNVYVLDLGEMHPSVSVPRTVAMAISNPLINFFDEMQIKDGFDRMVATTPGVQVGMVTYHGKLVDKLIGSYTSLPSIDIRVMLSETN